MHHPAERIVHTIAFVTTVVEHSLAGMRNSSPGGTIQWPAALKANTLTKELCPDLMKMVTILVSIM